VYRTAKGFRTSGTTPNGATTAADTGTTTPPVSIAALLDSATLSLPDTTQFQFRPYQVRYSTDFIARPVIGYERDTFGGGLYGGSSISLSDVLGDHNLVVAGALNGRIQESQIFGAYINQRKRLGWAAGLQQQPTYFYSPTRREYVDLNCTPSAICPDSAWRRTTRLRRFVVRQLFTQARYPFNRFTRAELGVSLINLNDATLEIAQLFADNGRFLGNDYSQTIDGPSVNYVQPSIAFVHDKTLFGTVGPFSGSRWRLQYAPTFGDWNFHSGTVDLRKYIFKAPFTIAVRGLFFGRFGSAADTFPAFLGNTELIRGYTAGSVIEHECNARRDDADTRTGCVALDRLIGSKIAVANVELRFPLSPGLQILGLPIPTVEGALFFDVGVAWNENSLLKLQFTDPNGDLIRRPLRSWGGSIRTNLLGLAVLRFDYTRPLDRDYENAYWTVSFGPTF
jgi:hypothetical protein